MATFRRRTCRTRPPDVRRHRTCGAPDRRRRRHRTPIVTSRTVDTRTRARVFFKCEHLQRAGAFKFRGAYNALANLSHDQQKRGVVAFSSGNHAGAGALAGQILGIPRVIVMPSDSPW
jgi:threonine dehydratase